MKTRFSTFAHHLGKYEPYLFILLLLAHLIPIFSSTYFVTTDGPAHLHNARLILSLIGEDNSVIGQYLEFNAGLVPNWTGHFLLAILLKFCSAALAEKIILALYLMGLPLAFRYLSNALGAGNKVTSYFIFPFTYSFLFYFGFYNFHIALVLYFFLMGLWIQSLKDGFSGLRVSALIALTLILYFSHLFVLAFFMMSVAVLNVIPVLWRQGIGFTQKKWTKNVFTQALVLLPALFLLGYYFFSSPFQGGGEITNFELSEKLKMLFQVSPAKGISYGKENKLTLWIFILLCLLLLHRLVTIFKSKERSSSTGALFSGSMCLLALGAFFMLPDQGGSFGFVSPRFCLMFFLLLLLFLSTSSLRTWMSIPIILALSILSLSFLRIYLKSNTKNKELLTGIVQASVHINAGDRILPLQAHDYWLYGHVSNYLGVHEPVIIYENYEAELGYFPLSWRADVSDEILLAKEIMASNNSLDLQKLEELAPDKILCIYDIGVTDAEKPELDQLRSPTSNYNQVFIAPNESVVLYERR